MNLGNFWKIHLPFLRHVVWVRLRGFLESVYFPSRYVIFMIHFLLTSISSTRQHTCSYAAVHEISRFCFSSFLPTPSRYQNFFGCLVYRFRQIGRNLTSPSQMSYPLIHRRKSWSCFKTLQFWLQFFHHQIWIWIGALLPNNVLSWLSYIHLSDRKCSRGWTSQLLMLLNYITTLSLNDLVDFSRDLSHTYTR